MRASRSDPPTRVVELGPGCRLWVRQPEPALAAALDRERDPDARRVRFGQHVIVKFEGVQLSRTPQPGADPPLRRWRPAMRQDWSLPFSPTNAGLLYCRASSVRAAVDQCLAEWPHADRAA